jgi:dCTP deaminase
MILNDLAIRNTLIENVDTAGPRHIIEPFHERSVRNGLSFGLSHAGYDIRCAQDALLRPGQFMLLSSVENFEMPTNLIAFVYDKSTWARRGLSLFNTVIEPGWRGEALTLEAKNQGDQLIRIQAGDPIAQIVFQRLVAPTTKPYSGKYQDQDANPVSAILEDAA